MIAVNNVTKKFGGLISVDGISMTVEQGEIFGLVGPDGAGKTTSIRMMTGIMELTAGNILLTNHQAALSRHEMGYMPQKFSLYKDLTVLENIRTMGCLYEVETSKIDDTARKILEFTNLWNFKDRMSDHLSGGMKQKLSLAAALIHNPKLLFLDEPTTGVDPVSRREFWQMLYQLNKRGMTILVSTPYMDEAELCNRVAFMNDGKITACASPRQLRCQYPYQILELKSDCKSIKNVLAACPILDINSFGDRYHLVVKDAELSMPLINKAVMAAGKQVLSLNVIPPTLEDVFVAMAGGEQFG